MSLKKFKSLPVHVVEDHDEALEFVYGCMGSRHLPLTGNAIIHFDSHPDLMIPKGMPADVVANKAELLESVSIESWIMPPCYAGHFSSVYWIKPHWSNQIPVGGYEVRVGKSGGEIRVHSDVYYWVSDGVCVAEEELEGAKSLKLTVSEMTEYAVVKEGSKGHYVLDVDLDFFSTKNPFAEMYEKGNLYEKLKPLFSFDVPPDLKLNSTRGEKIAREDILLEVSRKRAEQLKELELAFKRLEENRENVEEVVKGLPKSLVHAMRDVLDCVNEYYPDVDWYLLHSAGLTQDETELPEHVSTELELFEMFDGFEKVLKELENPPVLVTVSRSSEDEYCPPEQVDFIQEKVLEALKRRFGNVAVELHYRVGKFESGKKI